MSSMRDLPSPRSYGSYVAVVLITIFATLTTVFAVLYFTRPVVTATKNAQSASIATKIAELENDIKYPLTTMQPFMDPTLRPNDYPCSEHLLNLVTRVPAGMLVSEVVPAIDTTQYCETILKKVRSIKGAQAKVNYLTREYCSFKASSAISNIAHRNALNDIYGSLYGSLTIKYNQQYDTYDEIWHQRDETKVVHRDPYAVGHLPVLDYQANKVCPIL